MEISDEEIEKFPLRNVEEFVNVFERHLNDAEKDETEPNLAFLSILLGYLEYRLTLTKHGDSQSSSNESDADSLRMSASDFQKDADVQSDIDSDEDDFPILEFAIVEALYLKFSILVKSIIDKTSTENTTRSGYATADLCKKVSDILWNRLNPHYHKDKAHIQSLFSFLTGKQLDCFGLAFVVIAACQILRYNDVHLVLSEDHAWAAHGDNSKEMTEITWHGKGNEDKRGMSLQITNTERSWIYLDGDAIVCDRAMEVTALVLAINPAIDGHSDSSTMCEIQQRLLKMMYSRGALDKYPMALSVLADLEESEALHEKAVMSVEEYYNNGHVFPYCTQGQFYFRKENFKKAIHCWSEAAQVLSHYNYTREDEEIYKEIMVIAREFIPQALRSDPTISEDKDCFLHLIRFYDGICLWEEDSSTPVLHSWWAKYFTHTLGRFPSHIRELFGVEESYERSEEESKEYPTIERRPRRLSLRSEDSSHSAENDSSSRDPKKSLLGVKSVKMKGLEELLVGSKKFNAHAVSLQLTAQSQVHLTKRRPNTGEATTEYSGRIKKPKKFFE